MSEAFIQKNSKLLSEFDNYMLQHLEILDDIPDGAYVVITVKDDDKFNADSLAMSRKQMTKRDKAVEACKSGGGWTIRPLESQAA